MIVNWIFVLNQIIECRYQKILEDIYYRLLKNFLWFLEIQQIKWNKKHIWINEISTETFQLFVLIVLRKRTYLEDINDIKL